MSTKKLSNISISQFESFLELCLCKFIKNEKGHIKYSRGDLFRPLIFQNHIEPIPEFIVKNLLRSLGINKSDFWKILDGKKVVTSDGNHNYKIVDSKK